MSSRFVLLLVSVTLLLPVSVQLGHAFQLASEPDRDLVEIAQAGDSFSQIRLAMEYESRRDFTQAAKWYRQAADHGEPHAQNALAYLYQLGLGVPQSYEEAVKWYRRSAEQGNPNGQSNLAKMFADGTGVPQDSAQAAKLYRQSAEQGWAWAQATLAHMLVSGQGVPSDSIAAYSWCVLAITAEKPGSRWGCPELLHSLGTKMKPAEIAEANQRAYKWFEQRSQDPKQKHWDVGPFDSMNESGFTTNEQILTRLIGRAYAEGEVVPRDDQQALLWFQLGATRGDAPAQSDLGERYYQGRGVAKDPARAVALFRQSAEQGWMWGEHNLATCYAQGIGVTPDVQEAIRWFQKAGARGNSDSLHDLAAVLVNGSGATQDLPAAYLWLRLARAVGNADPVFWKIAVQLTEAQRAEANRRAAEWLKAHLDVPGFRTELAYMYWRGENVPKDSKMAVGLALSAAQAGDARAQTLMGILYDSGNGVPKDRIQAAKWYQIAAESGDMQGQTLLGMSYENGSGVPRSEADAIKWYQKAVDHPEPDSAALNNLAMMYATATDARLRNPTKALDYARLAVQLTHESDAGVLDTFAEAYYANGDYENAIATEKKALALNPRDADLERNLKKYQQAQKNEKR
jgi:TPR repeat protein